MITNSDAVQAQRTTGRRLLLAGAALLGVVGTVSGCASSAATPGAAPAPRTAWTSPALAASATHPAVAHRAPAHPVLAHATTARVGTARAVTVSATHPGTRADVPWSKVGSGWNVATWAPGENSRTTLFLVGPDGARYDIAHLPAHAEPMLWSPDGRRVLMFDVDGNDHPTEVDLHTGRTHEIALPSDGSVDSYSRPDGLALLATMYIDQGDHQIERLERFGTDGRHQQTYPASVSGAGALHEGVVETANGGELVVGAAHGLVLLRNNGTVVRRLHAVKDWCDVESWWSSDVVLASCGTGTLWAVPISGAKATRLTDGVTKENQFGYTAEWRYSRGRLGLAANGCGAPSLVRFTGEHGARFTPATPHGKQGRTFYVGHHGDVIDLGFSPLQGCQGGAQSLYAYNAVTKRATTLLGPGVNGGTVLRSTPFSTDE